MAEEVGGGDPNPAVQNGDDGYVDRLIVAIHGLDEYLDHSYRRLLDVLQELGGSVAKIDLRI